MIRKRVITGIGLLLVSVLILCLMFIVNGNNKFKKLYTEKYHSQFITLIDVKSRKIVFEKNGDKKTSPASLTKMLTAIIAIENIKNIEEKTIIDKEIYKKMVKDNASMAGFYGGETVTVNDLLHGTLLSSGGEACGTLSMLVNRDKSQFIKMMNEKAKSIGMKNSNFISPEGLDTKGQFTTSNDMAKLLEYCLNNKLFKKIVSTEKYLTSNTIDHPKGIELYSTVLKHLNGGNSFKILGGKSGTTLSAGLCWATFGEKSGKQYILITMGAPIDRISKPTMYQKMDQEKIYNQL